MIPPRAVWKTRPSGVVIRQPDVGAQQPDQVGRDRDGAGLVGGAVLQPAFLPGSAVIGPAPPVGRIVVGLPAPLRPPRSLASYRQAFLDVAQATRLGGPDRKNTRLNS